MDDISIVRLYHARDEAAIKATAEKYGAYCYAIAYNILKNHPDSEESVNDTYLGAWNSMPPNSPSVLSVFLGKITRRISIDKWRKQHADRRGGGEVSLVLDELTECIPDASDTEAELDKAELAKLIDSFVSSLPDTERRVFLLRYWYVKPVSSIADELGFTVSKVKSMLLRTRKKLKIILTKEGYQ